jgi:hypothetical protein
MEKQIIKPPQLVYLIELLQELGSEADNFILIGGQAMRFHLSNPRNTKDFDFVLNINALRKTSLNIYDVLKKLGYKAIPESKNFQFDKKIPKSSDVMRLEFLASEKERRHNNIRVSIQKNIHARACTGAEIALKECDYHSISLPSSDEIPKGIVIKVARPTVIVMLKLIAMDDRYNNIRGPEYTEHDRNEARINASDIMIIIHSYIKDPEFKKSFWNQFGDENQLKNRILYILLSYYAGIDSPGIQLYAEYLHKEGKNIDEEELLQALREIKFLISNSA